MTVTGNDDECRQTPDERGTPAAEVEHGPAQRTQHEPRICETDDEPVVPAKRFQELAFLDDRHTDPCITGNCLSHALPPSRARIRRQRRRAGEPNTLQSEIQYTAPVEPAAAPYNRAEMARPPITITCECGEVKRVPYGERWTCDCGRSWNTQQIPVEEYDGLLRRMRRHKLEALVASAIALAVFVPLVVFVSPRFFLLLPPAMMVWLFVLLPYWRRRYRRTASNAPRWQLHPE